MALRRSGPKRAVRAPNPRAAVRGRAPRLTRIRIQGLRTLEDVSIDLGKLTVLIGDNGAGKSSILEACEILRHVADGTSFLERVNSVHGGLHELRRFGTSTVTLGARAAVGSKTCDYEIAIGDGGIHRELLRVGSTVHLSRDLQVAWILKADGSAKFELRPPDPSRTMLSTPLPFAPSTAVSGMIPLLIDIEVHTAFDTTSRWIARAMKRETPLRSSRTLSPVGRVGIMGENLANAFFKLRNGRSPEDWGETLELVRLGLGYDVEDVVTEAQPGGGAIALTVKLTNPPAELPAYMLSDGMLAYLAFVAVFRLSGPGGLLAFDEPETHLHPELLARVMNFMHTAAEQRPVLLATHSDRLLDHLEDPAGSVVLCELDENRATHLVRPDAIGLKEWLVHYKGVGSVRMAGHGSGLFPRKWRKG